MANIERRNALYSSLYEDTHDLNTGGFNNTEAGQLYKSTGNTTNDYMTESANASGHTARQGSHGGLIFTPKKSQTRSEFGQQYAERKGLTNALADSAIENGASKPKFGQALSGAGMTNEQKYRAYFGSEPPAGMRDDVLASRIDEYEQNHSGFNNMLNRMDFAAMPEDKSPKPVYDDTGELDHYQTGDSVSRWNAARKNSGFTQDQQFEALYNQLMADGMSKDEILAFAQNGYEDYMTPEEAMRFYIYSDNRGDNKNATTGSIYMDQEKALRDAYERNRMFGQEDRKDSYSPTVSYNATLPTQEPQGLPPTTPRQGEEPQPGRPGGTYTPPAREVDDAYAQYVAQSSGSGGNGGIAWDVTRGADDQEDRKYSYSPNQSYSNEAAIASAINQWQQNKGARNALGAQTFNSDQQYQALYNALLTNGLSKEDIMSMAGGEDLPNLTPEQNMMLYYYAMNH